MGKSTIRKVAENADEIIRKLKIRIDELETLLTQDATPEDKKAWRNEWLKLLDAWRDVVRLLLDSEGYLELSKKAEDLEKELHAA